MFNYYVQQLFLVLSDLFGWTLVFKLILSIVPFTVPFSNMRTLKLKAQPTTAFFATANQMFSGSSAPSF